jgi:hypothetical protein
MKIEISTSLMVVTLVLPVVVFMAKTAMLVLLEKVRADQVIRIETNRTKVNRA